MSRNETRELATAAFTPLPTKEELWQEAERQKALETTQGHEGAVVQGTKFDPFPLLRAQRDFINAQVAFQHHHDVGVLVTCQKRYLEVLDAAIQTVDFRKLAGVQETAIQLMTSALEDLGVL